MCSLKYKQQLNCFGTMHTLVFTHHLVLRMYMYFSACIGDVVSSFHTGLSYEVAEVGLLQTRRVPTQRL